jgi:hypothetical protein
MWLPPTGSHVHATPSFLPPPLLLPPLLLPPLLPPPLLPPQSWDIYIGSILHSEDGDWRTQWTVGRSSTDNVAKCSELKIHLCWWFLTILVWRCRLFSSVGSDYHIWHLALFRFWIFIIVAFKNAEIEKVNNVLETTSFQGVMFTLLYFYIFEL